jgi:hypothetical protein
MVIKNPKGGSIIKIVIVVVAIVLAPIIGPLIGPIISDIVFGLLLNTLAPCSYNVFTNCVNNNGGAANSNQTACASAGNACGQRNSGYMVGGSCNATIPDNSQCPAPTIPPGSGFSATPSTIGVNGTTTLSWNTSNTTGCTITGDNGFTASGTGSGSVGTGPLTQTTTFTLTCVDGTDGPSSSASLRVIIDPHYKEI